jgi:hypothetical protein
MALTWNVFSEALCDSPQVTQARTHAHIPNKAPTLLSHTHTLEIPGMYTTCILSVGAT